MKIIMLTIAFGYSVANLYGMGAPSFSNSKQTYTNRQVRQFYYLDSWYTAQLQIYIDLYFDQRIDAGKFDAECHTLYNRYQSTRKRILGISVNKMIHTACLKSNNV